MRCAGFGQIIPTSRLHASSSRRIRVEAQPVDARSPSRSMHAFAGRATVRVDPATMVAERKASLWRWRIRVDAHLVDALSPSRSMHAYAGFATVRQDPTTMVAKRKAFRWRWPKVVAPLVVPVSPSFHMHAFAGGATGPVARATMPVERKAVFIRWHAEHCAILSSSRSNTFPGVATVVVVPAAFLVEADAF